MLLHTVDRGRGAGTGAKTALLLHGLMGSSESWWRVIAVLVDRGYRVLAMDLPGHGLSPRDPQLTVDKAATSVIETLESLGVDGPVHAMGHSYGATVLAAAAIDAEVTVYIDSALSFDGGDDRAQLTRRYAQDVRRRQDASWLRRSRPFYSARDAEVEARAADHFDPATSASISCGDDVVLNPMRGSILVHAEPSAWVSDDDKHRFAEQGVSIRGIRFAAHTVWYSHFDEFAASVPEMFGQYP